MSSSGQLCCIFLRAPHKQDLSHAVQGLLQYKDMTLIIWNTILKFIHTYRGGTWLTKLKSWTQNWLRQKVLQKLGDKGGTVVPIWLSLCVQWCLLDDFLEMLVKRCCAWFNLWETQLYSCHTCYLFMYCGIWRQHQSFLRTSCFCAPCNCV